MTDAIRKLFEMLAKKENSGSDYTGRVTRVDGNTAYVQFDGSDIADTPVTMSINADVGDVVRVRVANGKAWLTGNDSNPPNDSSGVRKLLVATNARLENIETKKITGKNGWINLGDGTFAYGGDALSWNGQLLKLKGRIQASEGNIGGWTIAPSALKKEVTSSGNTMTSQLSPDILGLCSIALGTAYSAAMTSNGIGVSEGTINGTTFTATKYASMSPDGIVTTGNLILKDDIYYMGTKATYGMIKFIDNTADTYGNGIAIGGGGATIIGGGESSTTVAVNPTYVPSGGSEVMIVANDSDIIFLSNVQNGIADAKEFRMNSSGNFVISGAGERYCEAYNKTTGVRILLDSGSSSAGIWAYGYNNGSSYVAYPSGQGWLLTQDRNGLVMVRSPYKYQTNYLNSYPIVTDGLPSSKQMIGSIMSSGNYLVLFGQWGSTASIDSANWSARSISVPASDPKLKENIDDCDTDALGLINQLPIHSFDWKESKKHWDFGFIAPELYEIDHRLAIEPIDEKGCWAVDDFYLTGVQTKAIQELSAKVTTLESEVADLKAEVAELKALLRERITNA